jgi:hypothetical protein
MDKVQKYNSFNTNIPSSESYRNYLCSSGSFSTFVGDHTVAGSISGSHNAECRSATESSKSLDLPLHPRSASCSSIPLSVSGELHAQAAVPAGK